MNIKTSPSCFFRSACLAVVLAAAGLPALHAQPAERPVHGRFLFIFDTSSNLKKRVPAVEKCLNTMLATSLGGQLQAGDTIGVWTFNQELHPGDFPLRAWDPDNAVVIASNLTQFVHSRKYANATRFEALQPLLNRVVEDSERLTVLIFSDGQTKITGTTFDNGINQLFAQNVAAQKKAREPFVVVLRSQLGKYTGCTVSYPPELVSFPQFPPLPPPPEPPPAPKPPPAPLPVPVVVAPSLLITGTNVETQPAKLVPTNPPPVSEPAPSVAAPTNTPVVAVVTPVIAPAVAPSIPAVMPTATVSAVESNPPPMPVVAPINPPAPAPEPAATPPANPIVPTNPPVIVPAAAPVVPTNAPASALTTAPTNHPVAATEKPAGMDKKPLLIGAVCLLAAGLITALAFFYFRRPDRRSLISRSMHDR